MDIVRSVTYIFDDEDWLSKIVITTLVSAVPFLNLAVLGWSIELIGNILNDDEYPLPAWNDFGQKFTAGLHLMLAGLIYNAVLVVLLCLLWFMGNASDQAGATTLGIGLSCLMTTFFGIYAIAANAALFIGMIRYSRTYSMASYLNVVDNLRIAGENIGALLLLVMTSTLAWLVISVFFWIPCIGWLAAFALSTPIHAHLQGQTAVDIVSNYSFKRKRH